MTVSDYSNHVRVRSNGLLIQNDALLMVRLHSPVTREPIWIPPGGGVGYGETLTRSLEREFEEETGLKVQVGALKHVSELVEPPFHAIEFYFEVKQKGGRLLTGYDPERSEEQQIIQDVAFIPIRKLDRYKVAPEKLNEVVTHMSESITFHPSG